MRATGRLAYWPPLLANFAYLQVANSLEAELPLSVLSIKLMLDKIPWVAKLLSNRTVSRPLQIVIENVYFVRMANQIG